MKWSYWVVALAMVMAACEGTKSRNSESHVDLPKAEPLMEAPHLTEEQEVEQIAQIREQQMRDEELFKQGLGDIAGNACKYRSSIGVRAPQRKVVLTFDDGPDANITPRVLDILKKHRIKATFFVTGNNASRHQNILKRAEAEGHLIGNHSWNHLNFHQLAFGQQSQQYVSTENVIRPFHGGTKYFRYPFGNSSCEMNSLLKSRGYNIVGWHVDSCDWGFEGTGTVSDKNARICGVRAANQSNFVAHVVETTRAKGGGILLFHDIRPRAMSKLESIIENLLRDGFEFVNLDDASVQPSLF
ncbi:MAG: polysaccharide deacetylase family protein [Bdellovibrionaceae bacterium]|nr:polysaccharide deacetylase family protein [Pseudobdellovibrionaceae bacterium]